MNGEPTRYKEERKTEFCNKVTTAWNFTMESNIDLNEASFDIKDEKVKYDNVFLFATKEEADKAVADGKIGDNDI